MAIGRPGSVMMPAFGVEVTSKMLFVKDDAAQPLEVTQVLRRSRSARHRRNRTTSMRGQGA